MAGLLDYGRQYMPGADTRSPLAQMRGLLGSAGDVYGAAASTAGRYARDNPLEAASLLMSAVPVVGDVLGLASDAKMYATEPESRTVGNMAMSALGALPFVPAMGAIKNAGLDMSQAARMARAKEMGFDTGAVQYHGTNAEFSAFDPQRIGSATDAGHLGRGFYTSTDPRVDYNRSVNMPLYSKTTNPLRIKMPDFRTDKKELVRKALGLDGLATSREVTEAARKAGYDSVIMDYSPTGYNHEETVVFDPSQLRSVHAAFDPAKRDSADLLASMGGLGLLGAAAYPYEGE